MRKFVKGTQELCEEEGQFAASERGETGRSPSKTKNGSSARRRARRQRDGGQCSGVVGISNGSFPDLHDGQLDDRITKGRLEGSRRKGRGTETGMDKGKGRRNEMRE